MKKHINLQTLNRLLLDTELVMFADVTQNPALLMLKRIVNSDVSYFPALPLAHFADINFKIQYQSIHHPQQ